MNDFNKEILRIQRKHLKKKLWDLFMVGCIIFIVYELATGL